MVLLHLVSSGKLMEMLYNCKQSLQTKPETRNIYINQFAVNNRVFAVTWTMHWLKYFHLNTAAAKCHQQQQCKEAASFLSQREGEEEGEEVWKQPRWRREQRKPGGSARPTGRAAQRQRAEAGAGRQERRPKETRRWAWAALDWQGMPAMSMYLRYDEAAPPIWSHLITKKKERWVWSVSDCRERMLCRFWLMHALLGQSRLPRRFTDAVGI